jgi:hypothetical protein
MGVWLAVVCVATVPVSAAAPGPHAVTQSGANVSVWDSSIPADVLTGVLPIGGAGQVNGDFVVATENGVQIGIRAQRRFSQSVDPLPNVKRGHEGIYIADSGTSDPFGAATWNIDVHLDLTGASGGAAATTLADYDFELRMDVAGKMEVVDLGTLGPIPPNTVLFQTSQNPVLNDPAFDPDADAVYRFELRLKPRSFAGPTMKTRMDVQVVRS